MWWQWEGCQRGEEVAVELGIGVVVIAVEFAMAVMVGSEVRSDDVPQSKVRRKTMYHACTCRLAPRRSILCA